MANRFQTVTFSQTVPAASSVTFGLTVPNNIINVAKLRIAQSIASAPTEFFIYKNSTYASGDLVYATKQYTGVLVDPVEDTGALVTERNEGYVCAFEDENQSLQMYIKIKNNHTLAVTYTGSIVVDTAYDHTGGGVVVGVPETLQDWAYASNLTIVSGVIASKNIATIDQAEFRATFVAQGSLPLSSYDMRTVAEGGTWVPNGTTRLQVTGIEANDTGAQHIFVSASPGIWYYAWRMHNSVGWSNWTDGNITPSRVTQRVSTRDQNAPDVGPPAGWDVVLQDGPASDTYVARASRPTTYGDIINFMAVQVKDADTGTWVSLLNGPDANNIKWDGRTTSLSINAYNNRLTDSGAGGFGTAAIGDLVLLDVRGNGSWSEAYCQWGVVRGVSASLLTIDGFFRPQPGATDFRIVIVKPPWAWSTGGYLGGVAGRGFWPQNKADGFRFIGDLKTEEFITTPIVIPSSVTNPEARVWFENSYSRSDDLLSHSSGLLGLPTARLWTRMDDKRWFIPMYGLPTWATTVINADGTVTLNAPAPRPAAVTPGAFYGIKGRFAVFPDATGVLIMRVKFADVQLPQYSTEGDPTFEGTMLMLGSFHPWGYYFNALSNVIVWGNVTNVANIRFGQGYASIINSTAQIVSGSTGAGTSSSGFDGVSRPASGYSLELRVGWGLPVGVGAGVELAMVTCEYSINGAAFVALSNIAKGNANKYGNLFAEGIVPAFGVYEPQHFTAGGNLHNWSCNVTEFEIVQGIIRQFRLQSQR